MKTSHSISGTSWGAVLTVVLLAGLLFSSGEGISLTYFPIESHASGEGLTPVTLESGESSYSYSLPASQGRIAPAKKYNPEEDFESSAWAGVVNYPHIDHQTMVGSLRQFPQLLIESGFSGFTPEIDSKRGPPNLGIS